MKWFNRAWSVCRQNFRKWSSDYRIWVIGIILVILTHYFTKDIGIFAQEMNIDVTPWIFPFLFTQKYVKLLFLFPLILLFCDAPFVDQNQPYMISRSGRTSWSIGQLGYIIIATAIYFLFLMFLSIAINFSQMQFTMEWGKVLGTLAKTNAAQVVGLKMSVASSILYYFSPMQAMWFTFLLSWLSGIFLGLTIYVINSLSNTRIFGVLAASFFLVLDAAITGRDHLYRFSPVSWSNLTRIDIEGTTQMPSITFIYTGFTVLILVLIIAAITTNRRQNINVLPPI